MSDSARDELLELTRLFSAHAAWQRELGASVVPSSGVMPVVVRAKPEAMPEAMPEAVSEVAPVAAEPAVVAVSESSAVVPAVTVEAPVTRVIEPVAVVAAAPKTFVAPVSRAAQPASLFVEPPAQTASVLRGPTVDGEERTRRLAMIADEVSGCRACRLGNTRKNTVFARGNPFARLFFIGEGPGEQEDLRGLPFVGPAGQLLDKIISRGMGLDPERDVYVGNIVKCRPPANRVPEADEMTACTPFLVRQLDLVRPDVIVALGRTAVSFLLDSRESMTRLRGKWTSYHGIAVMPTWHPSYLLRTPEAKGDTWADVKLVLERLGLPVPGKGA